MLPENRGAASPRIHAGVFYRAGLQRDRANRETHDAKTTTAPRSCAALPSARVGVQPTPAFGVASSNAGKAAGVQPQPLAHATRRRRQYDAKRSEHRVLTTPGLPRYLRPMRLFLCTTAEQRGYPGPAIGMLLTPVRGVSTCPLGKRLDPGHVKTVDPNPGKVPNRDAGRTPNREQNGLQNSACSNTCRRFAAAPGSGHQH